MSQIEELQHRIIAAMERIGAGVDAMQHAAPGEEPADDRLRTALDEERVANAQLQERLKSLKERHDQELDSLRAELDQARASSGDNAEVEGLREQLAEASTKLASVEAARLELAEAKEALENSEELDALKTENAQLRSEMDMLADTAPIQAELDELRGLVEKSKQIAAENSRLRSELADSERLEDLSAELDMLRAERASHGAAMSRLDSDLQRMRKANATLQSAIDELRAAAEQGQPVAELLDQVTAAELEATRAKQASDASEAHAILARLEPLLSKAELAEGEVE